MKWRASPCCSPEHIEDLGRATGLHGMWGVAPRAPIHIGYDRLVIQQIAMLEQGRIGRHSVLLADLHAQLDPILSAEEAKRRTKYYQAFFEYGCGLKASYFIGSEIQQSPEYVGKLYQLLPRIGLAAVRDVVPAGMRVRGQRETLSLVHIVMQCLDAIVLGADLVYAERSQDKVYSLLQLFPDRLMNGQVQFAYTASSRDVKGRPLAESSRATRISFHDSEDEIRGKVRVMYAPLGSTAGEGQDPRSNLLLDAYKWSVFPWTNEPVRVNSSQLGERSFTSFTAFHDAYCQEEIHPADCKETLVKLLLSRFSFVLSCMGSGVCAWVRPATQIDGTS